MFTSYDFSQLHYNESEAKKYNSCSRIQFIQERLAERALELLCLPPDEGPKIILDIGCGSGLSGSELHNFSGRNSVARSSLFCVFMYISEVLEEAGHVWVGTDIR